MRISTSKLLNLFGDVDTASSGYSGLRQLQAYNNNGLSIDLRRFMDFTLVPGVDAAESKKLKFDPYLSAFGGTEMVIQFNFENPLEVSTGTTPDRIVARFTDPRLLIDAETGMFIQSAPMISELPRMFMSDSATDVLMASCNVAASATNTMLVLFIIVGFSLVAMTKSIWQFINMV
jgi:hypothetical protein